MDEFAVPAGFEQLWERVTAAEADEVPKTPTEELEAFMNGEMRSISFYQTLAGQCTGCARQTLLRIMTDERRHLKMMQLEYFMRTGDSFVPAVPIPAEKTGVLAALREGFLAENETAAAYTAAGESRDGELGEIYAEIAADERRHAGQLREIIARSFTEQG